MFPFWEVAVAPVLVAAEAQRLVEIGALRGENTRQIIDRLGAGTELHVIDPVPDFDPEEHEREFGGQYVFHRDLSLNVLGDLEPMDAALIDGDHNWYTVYHECRLLAQVARAHDAPLPVLLLHDVAWPYGRRDLYYDPTNIPEEYRRDWKRSGMEPGKTRLVPYGAGLNPTLANAKVMGGKRNGVMTALDDFVAEHDRPLRVVVLPIYFGLAIVVEEERLARQPALAAELDRLESPEGKDQLLTLAEDVRLEGLIFQHKIYYDRERSVDRLAARYLGQVREGPIGRAVGDQELDRLSASLDAARDDIVLGVLGVLGARRPDDAAFLKAHVESHEQFQRQLWVFDGPDGQSGVGDRLARLDFLDDRTHAVPLDDSGPGVSLLPEHLCLLHVGAAAGPEPSVITDAWLNALVGRVTHGGFVLVGNDAADEVRAAVARSCERHGLERSSEDPACWRRRASEGVEPAVARSHADAAIST